MIPTAFKLCDAFAQILDYEDVIVQLSTALVVRTVESWDPDGFKGGLASFPSKVDYHELSTRNSCGLSG